MRSSTLSPPSLFCWIPFPVSQPVALAASSYANQFLEKSMHLHFLSLSFCLTSNITLSRLFHPPPIQSFCIVVVLIFFCSHLTVFCPHSLPVWPSVAFCTLFLHFYMIVSLWISLSAKAPTTTTPSWPLLSSLLHYITHFHALFHLHAQPTTVYLRSLALPLFLFCPLRKALWNELTQMAFYGSVQHNQPEHSRQS